MLEYFISTHGARKGLADTALRTADSGYLTRRLVDVAQDVIVREADCETDEGVEFSLFKDAGDIDYNLIGRCLLKPAKVPRGRKAFMNAGDYISCNEDLEMMVEAGVQTITARTTMTCHARHGICQKCYGWDLASGLSVDIGTAVGIIAAQSIGEPGTQLTMRTFHTGGVAGEDITHGLPRVTELFEARKPKGQAILAEIAGTLVIEEGEKSRDFIVTDKRKQEKIYTVSRRARIRPGVESGGSVAVGQQLTEGSVNPHDLLRLKGPNQTLRYIVDQVQEVYRSQGVDINDKHIEVIARQMLRKVTILEPGDSDLLPGQLVDRFVFVDINDKLLADGKEPAVGTPVLLGITKASLATDSYLSAASFQETTRVLTDAAIAGKEDHLMGLKENVIIGKLIPAATGMKRYRSVQLTYKGESAEWTKAAEGALPEFAPEELKELEAMLPGPSIADDTAGLSPTEAAAIFAGLDSPGAGTEENVDVSTFAGAVFEPEAAQAGKEASADVGDPLELTLSELGISTRWAQKLGAAGIGDVRELMTRSEDDILNIEGVGAKALEEIKDRLTVYKLELST